MASYSLRIKKSALKELEALPTKADRRRNVERIVLLADEPRPVGAQKLSGQQRYRLRQGRFRILYTISDRERLVQIVRIADRKEAYHD